MAAISSSDIGRGVACDSTPDATTLPIRAHSTVSAAITIDTGFPPPMQSVTIPFARLEDICQHLDCAASSGYIQHGALIALTMRRWGGSTLFDWIDPDTFETRAAHFVGGVFESETDWSGGMRRVTIAPPRPSSAVTWLIDVIRASTTRGPDGTGLIYDAIGTYGPCTVTVSDYPAWAAERQMTRFERPHDLHEITRYCIHCDPVLHEAPLDSTALGRAIIGHDASVGSVFTRCGSTYELVLHSGIKTTFDYPKRQQSTAAMERRARNALKLYPRYVGQLESDQLAALVAIRRGATLTGEQRRWMETCATILRSARAGTTPDVSEDHVVRVELCSHAFIAAISSRRVTDEE